MEIDLWVGSKEQNTKNFPPFETFVPEGYFGFYWEPVDAHLVGDIKCFDKKGQVTTGSQGACFVLTLRGIKTRERLIKRCQENGKAVEICLAKAVNHLTSILASAY